MIGACPAWRDGARGEGATMTTAASTSELACAAVAAAGLALLASTAPARAGSTERVSVSSKGVQGNDDSGLYDCSDAGGPSISAVGGFVAFESYATDLVPGDTNDQGDIFVRNRKTGTTKRISVGPNGVQGNGESAFPAISADGRFVAFWSSASNLVPGDTNGAGDIFVRDRKLDTTERVSVGPKGRQANDESFVPAISADGRFVAFISAASNLVPGDTNRASDIFVRDRKLGTTERVSLSSDGLQGNSDSFWTPSLSANGRFVAFTSTATNLVPGDTNRQEDIFVRDRRLGTTELVSVSSRGQQAN